MSTQSSRVLTGARGADFPLATLPIGPVLGPFVDCLSGEADVVTADALVPVGLVSAGVLVPDLLATVLDLYEPCARPYASATSISAGVGKRESIVK